jgi:hypothetical protein
VDFLSENFLSEGLNEYSTLSWFEEKYGRWDNMYAPQADLVNQEIVALSAAGYGHSYASYKLRTTSDAHALGWDEPLSAPAESKIANAATTVDYDTAWFVMSMLARYVGRDAFQAALGDLAREHRYDTLSAASFEAFLSERTGRDLKPFFDAFVYGTRSVDYEITGVLNGQWPAGYESRLTVTDRQDSGIFVPTTITLFLEDGTMSEWPVNAPGEVGIITTAAVIYAAVDRDAENLD